MDSKPRDINEYLSTLEDRDARKTLGELRRMIREAVPEAVESIGYGMPTFKYMGRPLVHFAASKNHCALYGLVGAKEAMREELAGYDTSKGTLRFARTQPPPEELVSKLLAVRVKEIKAAEKARKSARRRVPTETESLDGELMPRIPPIDYESAPPSIRAAYDAAGRRFGRVTNMKATLLHSIPAFDALMTWYDLRETVVPFLGERLADLFSHAISAETDCLICSTYFRKALTDAGQNPDELTLDEREQSVVEFGQCLAQPFSRVPNELYARLAGQLTQEQIVALTAFGAMMVATNVVNNALGVELDDYLLGYRKAESGQQAADPSIPQGER